MDEPNKQKVPNPILSGKKILWVEDDTFLSSLIAERLSTEGCELHHAKNGEEAFAVLETVKPDLILLDLLLPGVSGFDLLKSIRSGETTKNIPVIVLSNLGQKADLERGMRLGATKYLIKATAGLDEIVAEAAKVLSS